MRHSIGGTERKQQTKLNTFELFRRDSRKIDILTYVELYDTAFYIVSQRLPDAADRQSLLEDETETKLPEAQPTVEEFDDIPL